MEWISLKDRTPEIKDLPFVTKEGENFELWDDSDWFCELTEKEQLEWDYFLPLKV